MRYEMVDLDAIFEIEDKWGYNCLDILCFYKTMTTADADARK